MSNIGFVIPGISSLTPTQNKDTSASDDITPRITADIGNFDLDGDQNSLASITEALGQVLMIVDRRLWHDNPRRFLNKSCYN
ncbi:hypothetical protein M405DRAFT_812695 [Rhizopogon salebrosus TDB-379]|nr:hypothetical protein M405DRAFT_812695 [Rhizopogon salebrosus TDB-379]